MIKSHFCNLSYTLRVLFLQFFQFRLRSRLQAMVWWHPNPLVPSAYNKLSLRSDRTRISLILDPKQPLLPSTQTILLCCLQEPLTHRSLALSLLLWMWLLDMSHLLWSRPQSRFWSPLYLPFPLHPPLLPHLLCVSALLVPPPLLRWWISLLFRPSPGCRMCHIHRRKHKFNLRLSTSLSQRILLPLLLYYLQLSHLPAFPQQWSHPLLARQRRFDPLLLLPL